MRNKKNDKVVRLTEGDLKRIVKRVLTEGENSDYYGFRNTPPESLSMFTPDELKQILDNAVRLSDIGFFEEYEVESYLRYDVAKENSRVFRSLIGWLKGEYPHFNSGAFLMYDRLDGDNDYWA